jgi:hypothetical protein
MEAGGAAVTIVRNGVTNARPKDDVATASRASVEAWAEPGRVRITLALRVSLGEELATRNAISGASSVSLRGDVAAGSETFATR